MSEWISVKDRLPENGKIVLAYSKEKGVTFTHRLWFHQTDRPFVIEYEGMVKVTHWMPLPEPPKED